MISRREFLSAALGLAAGWTLGLPSRSLASLSAPFFFTQVSYRGGEWDPNPQFCRAIAEEVEQRTSVETVGERRVMALTDPDLYFCPFLYMAGRYEFEPFTAQETEALSRFLSYGGFLFAEDTVGAKGFGFDRSFRREIEMIFPGKGLERLPSDHPVFQSFYLIQDFGGRLKINPYLEGVTLDTWTPVIYSQNDLAGAWSQDGSGRWLHECVPDGEAQRVSAFRMGVNVVVYSLTSDYKRDLIHHPFLKRRQFT
jgi:hypothetical protein